MVHENNHPHPVGPRTKRMPDFFPLVIMNGRPAAGKSEIIRSLEETPVEKRIEQFHIGPTHIIDDFPMLWTWFEEDAILEELGRPRLHTTPDGYFKDDVKWWLLIRRLDLDYRKWRRDNGYQHTVIIEFSRGTSHGGYRTAYEHLSTDLLAEAALFYIDVSFEESLRKNEARSNPERPDSILQHSMSNEKMKTLYQDTDWREFTATDPAYVRIRGTRIPYCVFKNEDDVTTRGGAPLLSRLRESFDLLWSLYNPEQV
jgi:hypothetical protein